MESALYSLWRINIKNLAKNKLFICKDWHIQPSEIDNMVFYEYEWILESINKNNKEEAERQEKENERYEKMQSSYKNPSQLASGYKMPNYGSFGSGGSFKMPSMPSMPKF